MSRMLSSTGRRVRWNGSGELMELKMVWSISIGEMNRSKELTRETTLEKSRIAVSSRSTSVKVNRSVG